MRMRAARITGLLEISLEKDQGFKLIHLEREYTAVSEQLITTRLHLSRVA